MAVDTRQKSTARRLVSICTVVEVTYQMLFTSATAVTLLLAGSDGPADTKGIVA
jgi:hypothetical protein